MRNGLNLLMVTALLAVCGCECCKTSVPAAPHPKHVVFIGWDGCKGPAVTNAALPTLKRLMDTGSWTIKSRSILPSSSACNWRSITTCSASEQHGYIAWDSAKPVFEPIALNEKGNYPDIFSELRKARPAAEIGLFYEWEGIAKVADTSACSRFEKVTADNVVAKVGDYIREKKPDFLFVACDRPDHPGHDIGWDTPAYRAAVEKLDAQLGEILKAFDDAGIRQDTVVVLSSDHGGNGKSHGGPTLVEMERPVLIQGYGIRRNFKLPFPGTSYDTGATLAALLGLEFPRCWIGRPYYEAFE